MSMYGIKDALEEWLPSIDKILQESNVPIFKRFMQAAILFVDCAVSDSSFDSKEELFNSQAFNEGIMIHVNDWYLKKYGQLAKNPCNSFYSGIVTIYRQPVLVKIPSTTSKVEVPNETAWLTFPDSLQDSESMSDMFQLQIDIKKMPEEELNKLTLEFNDVVSMSRVINLNIMSAVILDKETFNMTQGIWGHIENAISGILSSNDSRVSIACWDLHLAIEKVLKIYLKQVSGNRPYEHNLQTISQKIKVIDPSLDLSLILDLPSDKDAIKYRYSELITNVGNAVEYYKKALLLVSQVTSKLPRSYKFNNMSILIKKAPWAK